MKKRFVFLGVLVFLAACRETVPASKNAGPDVGIVPASSSPVVATAAPTTALAPTASAAPTTASIAPRTPKAHRASAEACTAPRAASATSAPRSPTAGHASGHCTQDAECTDGKNGRCGPLGRRWGCSYDECASDNDCATGADKGVCACRASGSNAANTCKKGNCRVDADCKGSYCSPSLGSCGHMFGTVGYFCHTPKDECNDDDDCPGKTDGACRYIPEVGTFKCATNECKG